MFYQPQDADHGLAADPFKALVAPRPIGWISTLSAEGVANLAPYSFFNAVAEDPHYVAYGSGGAKHTLANIRATGEFCVNLVTAELAAAMNATSALVGPEVDEFELAGVKKAPCHLIRPPRVADSPVALECRLFHILDLPDRSGAVNDWLVVGQVVGIHIADRCISQGRVQTAAMGLIARLGYSHYATISESWAMRRPD